MKKFIILISTLISILSFSFVDGHYSVTKNNGQMQATMKMICKNGKILSVNFDEKYSSGKSIKLEDKFFASQAMKISNHVSLNNSINGVKIDFNNSTYSEDFKKLYEFLEQKAKNGEKGDFTI